MMPSMPNVLVLLDSHKIPICSTSVHQPVPLRVPSAVDLRPVNSVVAPELIGPVYTIHTVVVFINSQWDLEPFLHGVSKDGSDDKNEYLRAS